MPYFMKAWSIVGYTYRAGIFCPGCTCDMLMSETGPDERFDGWALADGVRMDPRDNIEELAQAFGYTDEREYDSDDFPKVIFASDAAHETCGGCGSELLA